MYASSGDAFWQAATKKEIKERVGDPKTNPLCLSSCPGLFNLFLGCLSVGRG